MSGWSAGVVHRAYTTMSQGIKRPFCLDSHRVTDLAAFSIQSFENEALADIADHASDIGQLTIPLSL